MSAVSWIRAALRSDAVGGSLLIGATVVALIWANSPFAGAYESLRSTVVGPAFLHLDLPVQAWAADGLLAVFFFIVGNELKQEIVHGELRDPRRAALPIAAALGGVVVPAGIFLAINSGAAARGWGIPMATDIAFALAVLAITGRHLPLPLRTFLLTLATVDDLCAVLVIAVAYTSALHLIALGGAVAGLVLFGALQKKGGWWLLGPLAVVIWALVHASGIHATVAGVAMGLLMRTSVRDGETISPSHRVEEVLRPFSAGIALPVFALMSAGISLSGAGTFWGSTITWGVLAGLLAGKFVGIVGVSWLMERFTGAALNPRIAWADIAGVGVLGAIGFTVSLLIAELSYPGGPDLTDAKGAVLLASTIASVLAAVVLGYRSRRYRRLARQEPAPT